MLLAFVARLILAGTFVTGVATGARAQTPYANLPRPYGDVTPQVNDEYLNRPAALNESSVAQLGPAKAPEAGLGKYQSHMAVRGGARRGV